MLTPGPLHPFGCRTRIGQPTATHGTSSVPEARVLGALVETLDIGAGCGVTMGDTELSFAEKIGVPSKVNKDQAV